MSKEEIENNLAGENKGEGINNSASMAQRPTIFLFIQHDCPDMSHSLYTIQPPLDLSGYDQMIDSEGYMVEADSKHISPVATFPNNDQFLRNSGSVNLGSKIYFFGGHHKQVEGSYSDRVQVFDTDHPEEGMRYVASMNGPKVSPCVFAADGMIYALGSPLDSQQKPTSLFERYNPSSNRWEVLPGPPPPMSLSKNTTHLDCATVLGRWVFIADLGAIFDLDTLTWDPSPPPKMVACLPYGSLFVNDSVYRLCGLAWVNTPQKFKQEWKPKLRNPDYRKTWDNNLKTLLAVKEDENRRLAAELAKKDEILKAYEALLAKTGGMVAV